MPVLAPSSNQITYVQKGGNDSTGNGALTAPYLTVNKAITSINDATPLKQYEINIGPGIYNESATGIAIPGNVIIRGRNSSITILQTNTLELGTKNFATSGSQDLVGLFDLYISPVSGNSLSADFNFTGASGNTNSKFYMNNCIIDPDVSVSITGLQEDNTEVIIQNCILGGSVTTENLGTFKSESNHFIDSLTLRSLSGSASSTMDVTLRNSSLDNNFNVEGNTGRTINASAINTSVIGNISFSGPQVTLLASSEFYSVSTISFTNGATFSYNSDAKGMGYSPTNVSDWLVPANSVQSALDILAANVKNFMISTGEQEIDTLLPLIGIDSAVAYVPHIYTILGSTTQVAGQIIVTCNNDIDAGTSYQFRIVYPPEIINAYTYITGQYTMSGIYDTFETLNLTSNFDSEGILIMFTSNTILFSGLSFVISYNFSLMA